MSYLDETNKQFYQEIFTELVTKKVKRLDWLRNKINDYKDKSANLPVDNSAYAKTEALDGYILEYIKLYKELHKLETTKSIES